MYNFDAAQAEETSSAAGLSSDNAIFLQPLKFDEEVKIIVPAPRIRF